MAARNYEKENAPLVRAAVETLLGLGATPTEDGWYQYEIQTIAGPLRISIRPRLAGLGIQFHSMFENVEVAVDRLNYRANQDSICRLNPNTGKWNHYPDMEELKDVGEWLRKLLKPYLGKEQNA